MEERGFFDNGLAFLILRVGGREIPALVDSGFSGDVVLPQSTLDEFGWLSVGVGLFQTADGRIMEATEYEAEIAWLGGARTVRVCSTEADLAMVGMGLLGAYRLILDGPAGIVHVAASAVP